MRHERLQRCRLLCSLAVSFILDRDLPTRGFCLAQHHAAAPPPHLPFSLTFGIDAKCQIISVCSIYQ